MRVWRFAIVVGMLILQGCSAAMLQAVAEGLAQSGGNGGQQLLIYGGTQHKIFLGCLNCSKGDQSSVLNNYGSFGSAYSGTSIFNRYSEHGSLYSATSACNAYASDPPVIVDRNGKFYGRLTLNKYHSQASRDGNTIAWLTAVCKS